MPIRTLPLPPTVRPIAVVLLVLTGLLGAPRAVRADAAYDQAVAQAVREFDAGNWSEARLMFKRAHELQPSARTWRALGLTAFELRRYVEAIAELEAALADSRKPLTKAQRQEVTRALKLARGYVATYELRVDPESAQLLIDGNAVVVPKDGKILLNPGSHTVVVHAAGHDALRRELVADAGAKDRLSLQLSVKPAYQDPAPDRADAGDARRNGKAAMVVGWSTASIALAAAGAAIGLGVATNNKGEEYSRCSQDCDPLQDQGERLKLATNTTAAIAALSAGGAVAAFVVGVKRGRRANELAVSLSRVTYTRRF